MCTRVRGSSVLTVAVTLATVLALATAVQASNPLPDGTERLLHGHSFMPSNYMGDPFVSTTLSNQIGGGMAVNPSRDFYDLDGNLLFEYQGTIFFAALGLNYQQNLWRTWALQIWVEGLVRSGANMESIVSDGATLDRDLQLQLKKRLLRRDRFQVSAGLDWGYSVVTLFSLRAFAEHLDNGGSLDSAPLTVDSKIWRSQLAANAVYAPGKSLGLRLNAAGGLYEVPDLSNVAKGVYTIDGMVDWDLKPATRVPLGISLGYTWGSPEDNPLTGLSGTVLGLWYTGQQDFTIGLETAWLKMPSLRSSEESDGLVALFSLRYWF